jgi:hypothetical protein
MYDILPFMDLINYFKNNKIKFTPWALEKGVSPSVISRFINGKGMSPENALKIEQATNGQVTRLELLYPSDNPAESGEIV